MHLSQVLSSDPAAGGVHPSDPAAGGVSLLVRMLDAGLPTPAYARPGDAGLDLPCRQDVCLAPGERRLVPTGVAVALPAGHVGFVTPRSGLAHRAGLSIVNAPGTVDSGYRGEILVNLVNLDPHEPAQLRRGDRIAQLVVLPVAQAQVRLVDSLPPSDRGETGHGSTGGFTDAAAARAGAGPDGQAGDRRRD